MRRGGVGGSSNGTDATETINAAATAIASAENRGPQPSVRKRTWGNWLGIYWCFGSSKNKRIGHATLVPETNTSGIDMSTNEHPMQPPSISLPFIAPPSSPASFLPSEPPSATQSPTGLLSLSVSSNMFSPGGPASIFAIGPYAHEPQLVSPPVFSTFTTEPSTAPYTPPPESVHMTTPSSPEVPFARLLEPEHNLQNGDQGQRYPLFQYEFQSYQLQPGSPVSHLISPSSGISGSGTSSPFPDRELTAGHPFFLEFKAGNPPQLLDLDKIVIRECESCQGSGAVTPDAARPSCGNTSIFNRQNSDITPLPDRSSSLQNIDVEDRRVSFEVTDEKVIRCLEKEVEARAEPSAELHIEEEKSNKTAKDSCNEVVCGKEDEMGVHRKKHRTITLGSGREFNFDNSDEGGGGVSSSEWWVNNNVSGSVSGEDERPGTNWSFFPMNMMQTGVSS